MKRFCVFGNPIQHSFSPTIHELFAQQLNHAIRYERRLSALYTFEKAVSQEFRRGLAGANVTVPFKVRACRLATKLTAEAEKSAAVNTLIPLANGGLLGANTDGFGLIHDLLRQHITLQGCRILVLGAGGAARGVLQNLVDEKPERIWLSNRTPSKAQQLAAAFEQIHVVSDWQQVNGVDVIINATSASLSASIPVVPASIFDSAQVIYDMVYGPTQTAFLRHASAFTDAKLSDGLGMLVGQAAESYRLWWDCDRPQIAPVIKTMREVLASHS